MTSKVIYLGDLRTEALHIRSQNTILTDAPIDNNGKGEAFSPTDLVATALGSCVMTIMGIASNTHGIDIKGATAEITKVMASNPRRISEIHIIITMPKNYTDKEKVILERAAHHCPVAQSLHPDLKEVIEIKYGSDE